MNHTEKPSDICAHLGDEYDRYLGAIVPPLFQNSLFTRKRQNHGYAYSRVTNPTIEILEEKLAALEHAQAARVFSSGMGAITATISSLLQSGDHVISLRSAYYPVTEFLQNEMSKFGVESDFLENFSREELEKAVKPNTKLIYFESPSSNIFKILPIQEIVAFAKERGIATAMDNTWATPLYQNPLDLGVDYTIHSATKYLGGHSDVIAGVVAGSKEKMDALRVNERALGGLHRPLCGMAADSQLAHIGGANGASQPQRTASCPFFASPPKGSACLLSRFGVTRRIRIGKASNAGVQRFDELCFKRGQRALHAVCEKLRDFPRGAELGRI